MALRLTSKDKEKIKRVNNSIRRKNKQMDNYDIDIYMPIITATKFTSRKQLNEYLVTTTSGKVVEVEEQPRQFKITGITSDSFVQLRLINS